MVWLERQVRPIDTKIFGDEIGTFAIDGIDQLVSFVLRLAANQQPSHLVFCWSVQKHAQSVVPVSQKMLGPSSDHDTVSPFPPHAAQRASSSS